MRRVALVRLRDGATVPFDHQRVRDSVERALRAAGREDRMLADEIASVVELFLEKTYYDEIPSTDQVEDMVEKVLIDTSHAGAAKAFILHRERRRQLRDSREAREEHFAPTLFDNRVVLVDDAAAGTVAPFSRARLARTLAADGQLPRATADEVAAEVESRLRRVGVARAPASLVRGIADTVLLASRSDVDLRRRGAAVLPPEQLAAALYRKSAGASERRGAPFPAVAATELGGAALRSHALSELLPAAVARAHLDGELHVHGLALPAALLTASFTPEEIKAGRAPGCGTRGVDAAARSARRLCAALGRSARFLGAAVTDGVGLTAVPVAFAPLLADASRETLNEEAWHLLHEVSSDVGGRRVELELSPVVPHALADQPARGAGGEELDVPNGELGGVAAAFSAAVLRAHASGKGLPGRSLLPLPSVTVTEGALVDERALAVLRLASEAVLSGARVIFPLMRDGRVSAGTSVSRGRGASATHCCAGRITLNLPRAAAKVGRDNVEGFLRECDRLVDVATAGHEARRRLLAQVAGAAGGSLAPLLRSTRGRAPFLDLRRATWSFGITGLNDALQLLCGFELHEGDDSAHRLARRIVSYLSVRVHQAGATADFEATLDADEGAEAASRLFRTDSQAHPADMADAFPDREAYTPGVGVRATAPVDFLVRAEREEALHAHLTTATLRLGLPGGELGGPDGLVALLRKLLHASSALQVEVTAW